MGHHGYVLCGSEMKRTERIRFQKLEILNILLLLLDLEEVDCFSVDKHFYIDRNEYGKILMLHSEDSVTTQLHTIIVLG